MTDADYVAYLEGLICRVWRRFGDCLPDEHEWDEARGTYTERSYVIREVKTIATGEPSHD